MKTNILLVLLIIPCFTFAQNIKNIHWEDLKANIEFEDPFKKLSSEQLYNLRKVAKYRENIKKQDFTNAPELKRRNDSLEVLLAKENVDVDMLLSQRDKIAQLRRQQAEAVNENLNEQNVNISGYLLPLNFVDNKTTEFLLVPWVGACIHTPPPPANQLIYIHSNEALEFESRYKPVTVEGVVEINTRNSMLFFVDGSDEITSGYTILDAQINEYKN